MKLNVRLLELLAASTNSVVWVPRMETGGVSMARNVPLVFIYGTHTAQLGSQTFLLSFQPRNQNLKVLLKA